MLHSLSIISAHIHMCHCEYTRDEIKRGRNMKIKYYGEPPDVMQAMRMHILR